MRTKWPEEIEIPERIGKGQYRYRDMRPCCALGHYHKEFGTRKDTEVPDSLKDAFIECAMVLRPCEYKNIPFINDKVLTPRERVLVYAAALAYVGYTLHNFPEAEELARKAKGTK